MTFFGEIVNGLKYRDLPKYMRKLPIVEVELETPLKSLREEVTGLCWPFTGHTSWRKNRVRYVFGEDPIYVALGPGYRCSTRGVEVEFHRAVRNILLRKGTGEEKTSIKSVIKLEEEKCRQIGDYAD